MKSRSRALLVGLTVTGVGATLVIGGPAVAATKSKAPHTVYVGSKAPKPAGTKSSCANPNYTAIQTAIEAVAVKGTVVVCKGTYPGLVNVDKRITLQGRPGATINAKGDVYGIGVSASWSTVRGMRVIDASPLNPEKNELADGILTAALGEKGPVSANHVTIVHNIVTGNLGSGIDINSSSYSTASYNVAHANGVGINVADDVSAGANHNKVTHNITNGNLGGCGIALADHSGAGVSHNLVAYNISNNNGFGTATATDASAGSGVILASPVPGAKVTDNSILYNTFNGNGHGGVVIHAHVPGGDVSGNVIVANHIGRNNLRTDENDPKTTGIYLGNASPMTIKIARNTIGPDYYGIFTSGGPITIKQFGNHYVGVTQKLGTFSTF